MHGEAARQHEGQSCPGHGRSQAAVRSSLENGIIPQPSAGRHRCRCSACKGPVIFKKTHFEADWSLSEQISCSFS